MVVLSVFLCSLAPGIVPRTGQIPAPPTPLSGVWPLLVCTASQAGPLLHPGLCYIAGSADPWSAGLCFPLTQRLQETSPVHTNHLCAAFFGSREVQELLWPLCPLVLPCPSLVPSAVLLLVSPRRGLESPGREGLYPLRAGLSAASQFCAHPRPTWLCSFPYNLLEALISP